MEILENAEQWVAGFRRDWLSPLEETGTPEWDGYKRVKNRETPGGPGTRLGGSRLMLISSAGGFLRERQEPFDAASVYGDYSMRTFPPSTPFDALAYAHDHYDHAMVDQDPQVALPLRYLEQMASEGWVGALAPSVISFMGYQPDAYAVVQELYPQVLALAKEQDVQAVLLAPV